MLTLRLFDFGVGHFKRLVEKALEYSEHAE